MVQTIFSNNTFVEEVFLLNLPTTQLKASDTHPVQSKASWHTDSSLAGA